MVNRRPQPKPLPVHPLYHPLPSIHILPSYIPLPTPRKKEPHNRNLHPRHRHHHQHLNQTEIKDPLLRAPDRAEIPVLPRPEIFLHAGHGAQLPAHFEDEVFKCGVLFGGGAGFLREERGFGFVFDLDSVFCQIVGWEGMLEVEGERTATSKSTILSANVDISLLKHTRYSPTFCAVKTKSPCLSFSPAIIRLSLGPTTS